LLLALLAAVSAVPAAEAPQLGSLRYDSDYPGIPYSGTATHNAFARLQQRIDRGEVKLDYHPTRGYLDALLKALNIDPASQVLVYSKTSLQIDGIVAATPRAVYFNDQVYVGFVQDMPLLELAAIDSELGLVFYTIVNRPPVAPRFDREAGRCLTCHDTYSMLGGGVPRIMVLSAAVDGEHNPSGRETSEETTDQTALRDRWGGWYVTGQVGRQLHLGNLPVSGDPLLAGRSDAQRLNLKTLDALFNTKPYIGNQSDVVALMVLEHQTAVQNLITRANFKLRTVLPRFEGGVMPTQLEGLSPKSQTTVKALLEPLTRQLLFADAIEFTEPVSGYSGFDKAFEARGPRDARGRSLRQLDLKRTLFRWPVSYFIQSESFDALPQLGRQYVYARVLAVLRGQDAGPGFDRWSAQDRADALQILMATKPEFARYVAAGRLITRMPAITNSVPAS
jgi:hypothetical protein